MVQENSALIVSILVNQSEGGVRNDFFGLLAFGLGLYAIAERDILFAIYAALAMVMVVAIKAKEEGNLSFIASDLVNFVGGIGALLLWMVGLFAVTAVVFYAWMYKWWVALAIVVLFVGISIQNKENKENFVARLLMGIKMGISVAAALLVLGMVLQSCSSSGDYNSPMRRINFEEPVHDRSLGSGTCGPTVVCQTLLSS